MTELHIGLRDSAETWRAVPPPRVPNALMPPRSWLARAPAQGLAPSAPA